MNVDHLVHGLTTGAGPLFVLRNRALHTVEAVKFGAMGALLRLEDDVSAEGADEMVDHVR